MLAVSAERLKLAKVSFFLSMRLLFFCLFTAVHVREQLFARAAQTSICQDIVFSFDKKRREPAVHAWAQLGQVKKARLSRPHRR